MIEIRIYVEGGGRDHASKRQIRTGFNRFFQPLRDLARGRIEIIPCGPRSAAFENFKAALKRHPAAFNVLLVDAEAPITKGPWQHLHLRDGWKIQNLPEGHCHLMVQTIEAWLIADPETLAAFYGQGFRRNALPRRQDVEAIPKEDLARALDRATEATKKGRYHKIFHCSVLLGLLNRDRVRSRARHCDLLFTTLEARIRSAG